MLVIEQVLYFFIGGRKFCAGVLCYQNSVPNGGLNPLRSDGGCPLQAGTGHGRPLPPRSSSQTVVGCLLGGVRSGPGAARTILLFWKSCRIV
jgi:hypothetical protein